jgi:aminocarboxymuconate-semialdehyde decarboxylase
MRGSAEGDDMRISRRRAIETGLRAASGVLGGVVCAASAARAIEQPTRRPVTVGGRRVRTIDIHAHCVIPEALELIPGARANPPSLVLGPERLVDMNAQRIDVQVLSINQFWYAAGPDVAGRVVDLQNERLAEVCAAHSERYVPLASVALQHPELAAEQLDKAVRKLGMRGVAIAAHVNGDELSAPKFHPFWAKAEELGVVVFIHPQAVPELEARLRGNGGLANVIGNPLDTTIALSHLIFEGTLDTFPALKICAAHGGGYLGSYRARSDRGCAAAPNANCTKTLKKAPSEYLKQIFVDSIVFTSEALRHLVAESGADRVLMGTDYPYPWNRTAVDHVLQTPGLSDADRVAILGGTASRLLGLHG